MAAAVDRFFQSYIDAFNRSLGDRVDVEGIRSHFSDCFVAAGPRGVLCGENSDEFAETLRQGYAFYISIGTRAMAVRGVTTTPTGEMVEIDFAVTYFFASRDESFEIFGFVAGDEMALYREHRLLPDAPG